MSEGPYPNAVAAGGATERCGGPCEVHDCVCEGFGSCIGRCGHLSRPHRCQTQAMPAPSANTMTQCPVAPPSFTMTIGQPAAAPKAMQSRRGGPPADDPDAAPLKSQKWAVANPRRCWHCPVETFVRGTRNQYCIWWICSQCDRRTAENWFEKSKKLKQGRVEHCHMAVTRPTKELID